MSEKFHPASIARLENPRRLEELPPARLLEAAGIGPGNYGRTLVIVDIGTGAGIFARALAGLLPHALIHACDVSSAMLDHLRASLTNLGPELRARVLPTLSGENSLPLADASADLVLLVRVFHELDEPAAVLREAARVLKPGGMLVAADWRREPMAKGPPVEERVSAEQAISALRKAGFFDAQLFGTSLHDWIVSGKKDQPGA
jgi:ubiquinone/menaquinone biosynthesis C-methylase UbiE